MTIPPASPPPEAAGRGRILAVLLLPLFMGLLDVSVVNVALPAIQTGLRATSTQLQWVLAGYGLAFGVVLIPAGRLGDATGRRRLFLIGMGVFTVGSLLCGLAPSDFFLNVARLIQGVGAGLFNPQTIGMMQRHFQGQARARAFGMMGTVVGVSTAIGPVLGGALVSGLGPDLGWRSIFLLNVPLGAVAIVGGLAWLPADRITRPGRADLDPVGTMLLTVGVLAFMLGFVERGAGWAVLAMPVAGLVLMAVWVWWERRYKVRGHEPMVDLSLFQEPGFRNGILLIGVHFLGMTSVWVVVALFVQQGLGHSALMAGLIGLPAAIANALTSPLGGRYILRFRRRLVLWGFAASVTAVIGTMAITPGVAGYAFPPWVLGVPLVLVGAGQGLIVSPNQTLTLESVDVRLGGVAGGVLQTAQRLGAAVGTAMIPGLLFQLVESGRGWTTAVLAAFGVITLLMLAAAGVGVNDLWRERRMGVGPSRRGIDPAEFAGPPV